MEAEEVVIQDFRDSLRKYVDRVLENSTDVVVVTRYGRKVAVLVGYEKYKELIDCDEK